MRRVWPLALAALLAGCSFPQTAQRERQAEANIERATNPIGRYQGVGKREYANGSDVYLVDTKTGRVCYGFITNNSEPDTMRCTGPAYE